MQDGPVLGIDIGGTKLAVGIVDLATNTVIASRRADTPANLGGSAVYEAARDLCQQLPDLSKIRAIGVCYGGQVYENHVLRSNQVSGWDDFPLEQRLAEDIAPVPIRIVNDANAIAWLEWTQRPGLNSLFYVTVSTGIGGGYVLNERIVEGRNGLGGEIGHMILVPGGVQCVCGRQGCLEALAAGPAISREYTTRTGTYLPAMEIAARARRGDAAAVTVFSASARYVGRALAAMNILLDVDTIVIGGGVSRAGDVWWPHLIDQLHADTPRWGTPPAVEPSTFGELEGVLAGATAIKNNPP